MLTPKSSATLVRVCPTSCTTTSLFTSPSVRTVISSVISPLVSLNELIQYMESNTSIYMSHMIFHGSLDAKSGWLFYRIYGDTIVLNCVHRITSHLLVHLGREQSRILNSDWLCAYIYIFQRRLDMVELCQIND